MTESPITVDVRLFAVTRELAGVDRLQLQLPRGTSAQTALDLLWKQLNVEEPAICPSIAIAINEVYASRDQILIDGDELALIPPVSGGQDVVDQDGWTVDQTDGQPKVAVWIGEQPISGHRAAKLVASPAAGAVVTFTGLPRDIDSLAYEAHDSMARQLMLKTAFQVAAKHRVCAIAVAHRTGVVEAGQPSILVSASAPHRGEAFAAARELLDLVKLTVPIWKEEVAGQERSRVEGTPVETLSQTVAVPTPNLTHLAADGAATMVDVGGKVESERFALAAALVQVTPQTAQLVLDGNLPKGDVITLARLAGVQAAKQASNLVFLAHPLPLTKADVQIEVVQPLGQIRITATAKTVAKTGVEIEAMTAASVAALNVYDMVKGVQQGATISSVTLLKKTGGKSDFAAAAPWA